MMIVLNLCRSLWRAFGASTHLGLVVVIELAAYIAGKVSSRDEED